MFLGGSWKTEELKKFLEEFGFQFSGPVDLKGLTGAKLPNGWTTEGDVWVPGQGWSNQWWILDDKGHKRIAVRKKIPWGESDWHYFMIIEPSSPGTQDPRLGW